MSIFIPTRINNPCVICGDTSGKCRETRHVNLCMTFADASHYSQGFRFIGRTKDNLWGKWIKHRNLNSNNPKIIGTKGFRPQPEIKRQETVLPADQRDRLYRTLLNQLPLHPNDQQDLIQRGLSKEQIEHWGVKSVEQWQSLTVPLPVSLPGIVQQGRSLNIPHAGYLCPIRDHQNRIVACQIRTRTITSDNPKHSPKYYWLTSKTTKNPLGAKPHLIEKELIKGELPLSVYCPTHITSNAIALVEGTGAKPYLTSERCQSITIGAAGGQFSSSPKTLENALHHYGKQLNTTTIEFYPDAGAVNNSHVLRQYRRTWTLLKKLGFTIHIMWWNQLTKQSPDIDELTDLKNIQAISVEDFEAIAQQPKHILHQLSTLFGIGKQKSQSPQSESHNRTLPICSDPTIQVYQRGKRLQTWQQAITQGYKYILDSSQTGTGKSFDAGLVNPSIHTSVDRVIYLSDQHRNPTVTTLSSTNGWGDLEAKHPGLMRDRSPNGSIRLRRTSHSEISDIPGNCSRTQTIQALHNKQVIDNKTSTLICNLCPMKNNCIQSEGNGYGFLHQRRTSLASSKFRAHPDSLPSTDDFSYSSSLLIWDEPGQTFNIRQDIHVNLTDIEQAISTLLKYDELFDSVRPLIQALIPYLNGSTQTNKFGLSHEEVLTIVPTSHHIDLEAIEQALSPNLSFLHQSTIHPLTETLQNDSNTADYTERKVLKNWIPTLLQILNKTIRGSLAIKRGVLTITTLNPQHPTIAHNAIATLFLDATLSKADLALKLQCSTEDILEVKQLTTAQTNLNIIQITDLGRMGMQRGSQQQKRAQILINHYKQIDPTTKVIDFKKYDADGAWWRDSRGVNDFSHVKTLILVGTPCRNLIDQLAEYALLTGNHKMNSIQFQEFINRTIFADLQQAIGRLRHHRRPQETVNVILISNTELIPQSMKKTASQISPYAATKKEKFIQSSLRALQFLQNQGKKLTQIAVAKITGYSQQYISRFWALLLSLIGHLNSKSSSMQTTNERQCCETGESALIQDSKLPRVSAEASSSKEQYSPRIHQWFNTLSTDQWNCIEWYFSELNRNLLICRSSQYPDLHTS